MSLVPPNADPRLHEEGPHLSRLFKMAYKEHLDWRAK
jgi:hypothetical protein